MARCPLKTITKAFIHFHQFQWKVKNLATPRRAAPVPVLYTGTLSRGYFRLSAKGQLRSTDYFYAREETPPSRCFVNTRFQEYIGERHAARDLGRQKERRERG